MTAAKPPFLPLADLVLKGGRVVDPASGSDAIQDVALTGDRITAVGEALDGRQALDVSGLIVAPGAIDLHSHSQSLAGHRLQAFDGVTTSLELEAGATPVARACEIAAAHGRPLNYGFSASWALTRLAVLTELEPDGDLGAFLTHIGDSGWQRAASRHEVAAIIARLERDLEDGALGIGILLGYAPEVDPSEYLTVARLAAARNVPTYTHARELVEADPDVPIDGAEEIIRTAGETGAHMHYCHIHSSSRRHIDRVLGLVDRARSEGSMVTTEAYPYGSGMTGIGASFLAPERLPRWGLTSRSLTYMPTGERVADDERLRELREQDPGGLVAIELLDEADHEDRALLHRGLLFEDSAVASDAMPLTWVEGVPDDSVWPLPRGAVTHPRTAGTYSRSLRILTREYGFSLLEAIARTSFRPAQILEASIPAMRLKGRVQPGCDADLAVFDAETISDRATYQDSTRTSIGIHHLLVNGEFVVRGGELNPEARPGRAILNDGGG